MGLDINKMKMCALYKADDNLYISKHYDPTSQTKAVILHIYQFNEDGQIVSYKFGKPISFGEMDEPKIVINGWSCSVNSVYDDCLDYQTPQDIDIPVGSFEEVLPIQAYKMNVEIIRFLSDKSTYFSGVRQKTIRKSIPGEV